MLVRQIGTVVQEAIRTDEQILLAESSGGGSGGITAIQNTATPTGAAATTVTPTSVPNVSTVSPGASTVKNHPLLWAGLGAGAAYLLSRGGDTMSGVKKKSLLVPALIVGGAAVAWYFMKKPAATNPEKDWLLNTFHATNESNQQAMLAAIPKMTDTDLHLLYLAATAVANGTGLNAADTTAIDAMMLKYGLAGL